MLPNNLSKRNLDQDLFFKLFKLIEDPFRVDPSEVHVDL